MAHTSVCQMMILGWQYRDDQRKPRSIGEVLNGEGDSTIYVDESFVMAPV
jgi:hypothetical protein